MGENLFVDLSKQFAIDTINLCTEIQNNLKNYVLANQLLRSGTSVGAIYMKRTMLPAGLILSISCK